MWSQKARPDVQTSIRPGLKSSCSVIRIDAARYYSASLRLQQIFDAAAKRAGQSEHGGDGSFAKVFAALLVHLDGAQGNAGAAGQPGLAESGAHADRVQPGVALGAIMGGPLVVHVDESAFVGFVQSRVQSHDIVERQHIENVREPHSPGPLAVCEYPSGPVFGC